MHENSGEGGNSVNYVLNSDILCNHVNNCCKNAHDMYFTSGNVVNKGIKDIGFTPGSSNNKYTIFKSLCVDINKAFDNVDIYIDKVNFFCDDWCQKITFPYYLVFLHGINGPNKRGFYYANFDTDTTVVLYTCREVSSNYLRVLFFGFMYVHHFIHEHIDYLSVDECLQAKIVYNDWKKDVFIRETVGMSYCEYIVGIIDHLICQQELGSDIGNTCSSKSLDNQIITETRSNKDLQVPRFIEDVFLQDVVFNDKCRDPNFPDKVRGFMNHSSAEFFICGA